MTRHKIHTLLVTIISTETHSRSLRPLSPLHPILISLSFSLDSFIPSPQSPSPLLSLDFSLFLRQSPPFWGSSPLHCALAEKTWRVQLPRKSFTILWCSAPPDLLKSLNFAAKYPDPRLSSAPNFSEIS